MPCNCDNDRFGFNCMCDWMRDHPGDIEFTCEFCGIYNASKPRCEKCLEIAVDDSNGNPITMKQLQEKFSKT